MDQEIPWELWTLCFRKAEASLRHDLQELVGQKNLSYTSEKAYMDAWIYLT